MAKREVDGFLQFDSVLHQTVFRWRQGREITFETVKTNHGLPAYLNNLSNEIIETEALDSLLYFNIFLK